MMHVKRFFYLSAFCLIISGTASGQEKSLFRFLLNGIVMDASTLTPIPNTQVFINRNFSAVTNTDGTFAIYLDKNDSVLFKHLGYKSTLWALSDTLKGNDFVAGIYLHADTVSIGEVIIIPRYNNIKSKIMNSPSKVPPEMENAKYNVAVSGYTGRTTQGKLGDPSANYGLLREQQKTAAYERGEIPSDQIAGLNPLLLLPAAYLLMHGLPEKPASFQNKPTQSELGKINDLYLKSLNKK